MTDVNLRQHFQPAGPDSWYNLPRAGGVSYATQESWVENETIKNNILFGSPFDEERYKKGRYPTKTLVPLLNC